MGKNGSFRLVGTVWLGKGGYAWGRPEASDCELRSPMPSLFPKVFGQYVCVKYFKMITQPSQNDHYLL